MTSKLLAPLVAALEDLKSQVETLRDERQEDFDELSENAQEGPKGELLTEQIGHLEDAIEALDNAVDAIQGAS